MRGVGQAGFTLLEVVIALAILAISLAVFMESQVASLSSAARARDLTVATLLARSKMVDVERLLFDEGFTMGDSQDEGDFRDEGYPDITWKYSIAEVKLDLAGLSSLCEGFGGSGGDSGGGLSCESVLSGLGGPLQSFTDEVGRSLRAVEVRVAWPEGAHTGSMAVRALLTREDFTAATPGGGGPPLPLP